MSEFKIQMPKLGESVQEATITKWFVKEGDKIEEDDSLFEVATDKVDSEIPSPVDGVISKIFYQQDALVPVGETVAIVAIEDEDGDEDTPSDDTQEAKTQEKSEKKETRTEAVITDSPKEVPKDTPENKEDTTTTEVSDFKNSTSGRFYSPLVRSIAREESVSLDELDQIEGSGQSGRVQKKDILQYLQDRKNGKATTRSAPSQNIQQGRISESIGAPGQIIEMDRVRKLIAEHMVRSKQTSPHVTSVVEADVTNLVLWRNKAKDEFLKKYNEKLTFMPVFIEAATRALTEYPLVNSSVKEDKIHIHKNVNMGIAVAKPDGNLVVPVIKEAEQKNLLGLTQGLNSMAQKARENKLGLDDYQGGTFTITNFGSFRNIIGTPIINQPQVAILATGSIEKKPAVMETLTGDVIVVRHKMYLSLSYDHRIIDGALGGAFLRRIADILEAFDINREI